MNIHYALHALIGLMVCFTMNGWRGREDTNWEVFIVLKPPTIVEVENYEALSEGEVKRRQIRDSDGLPGW